MRLAWLLLAAMAAFAADPITMTDLLKIRRVTNVEIARDGSFAVYGVQSVHTEPPAGKDADPAYSYRTHLYLVDLNDAAAKPVPLTHGARSDSGFAVSPDGKWLAFQRTDNNKPQVWLMPLRTPGEAYPVTKLEHGAVNPVWRPDGQALLVASPVPLSKVEGTPHWEMERPARQWFDWDKAKKDAPASPDGDRTAVRNWLERNAAKDSPFTINRINFLGEQALAPEATVATLFLIDLTQNHKATQLTKDFHSRGAYSFSPDAKQIVYVSTPPVKTHPDRLRRQSIWIMNADGSNARTLLDDEKWAYGSPRFAGDGQSLYFTGSETDQPGFRQAKLGRFEAGRITWLATDWKSGVNDLTVASDGAVLFTSNWHGGQPLNRAGPDGKSATWIGGPVGVSAYDEANGRIVFAQISVANPNELYLREKDGRIRRLTDLNQTWLATKIVSQPEEHWITRPDGTRVQYWIMNPVNAEAGKKHPFVLDMHGGPSAMWGPGEFSMWHEFQLFNAWGYGVVYANPRGSSGYGYEHQRGNYRNWGDGPQGDVLGALDDAAKHTPFIDQNRLFLTGGSYAGYLTAWIIGHDQRFKAAAAQRGVYDLTTFFGEANAFRLVENHFGGFPWEPEVAKILDYNSPFTYVDKIRTPFLILHGSEDFRTGIAQSEMLYKALKQLVRPVEYVRYPRIGHEQTRSGPPAARMDHMLRIIEFFERYAGNERAAPGSGK